MTADQRFAAPRPDVLVYQTPTCWTEDMTVAGPIEVDAARLARPAPTPTGW